MAVNIHKGYPDRCLEDSYECKTSEGILKGMAVKLDNTSGKLVKADGTAGEYAMIAMNDQPTNLAENGSKIQVVKENASLWTSFYKATSYTLHCKLQVSATGGEQGILTPHLGAGAPVMGRYIKVETINGVSMMLFDLVRS